MVDAVSGDTNEANETASKTGRFTMDAPLPEDWYDLRLEVARDGYETTGVYVNSGPGDETTLMRMATSAGGDIWVFGGAFAPAPGRMRLTAR